MKVKIIIGILILTIVGCSSHNKKIGVSEHTGFTELPFPSNNYSTGQIVEIYTKPSKVEITHESSINWDQISTSKGWNISSYQTKEIQSSLTAEISNILKGEYSFATTKNVLVEFTNTKTTSIPKNVIFEEVSKSIQNNPNLKKQILLYMNSGTHFDVITQTLSANISFHLIDSLKTTVEINSEIIEEINSKFDIDFKKNNSNNTVISGSNLVIGIHTDPKLINLIMEDILNK